VDGTLIEVERTKQYEGWYCRKGFPAINLQVVVDGRKRIRDYSMRPGSENDSGVFSRSHFGQTIHQLLPTGKCILADAGYKLYSHCLTPYDYKEGMPKDERTYNYLHSKTRITVECALGLLKGRFRRLKTALGQKGNVNNGNNPNKVPAHPAQRAARIIRSSLIMHNILIDLNDATTIIEDGEDENVQDDNNIDAQNVPTDLLSGKAAKQIRDAVKVYLNELVSSQIIKL
jgi:hypothetical protein